MVGSDPAVSESREWTGARRWSCACGGDAGALRALAQWSAERRQADVRMQNLKQDRQLNQVLAFTGKGE